MPTFIHSKLTVFKLDNAAGSLTDISTFTNSVSWPRELEEVDTTTFGATARQFIAGFAASSVSISGLFDRAHDTMMSAVYAAFEAGTLLSVSAEYGPEGSTSGDIKKTAELVMQSYELGSEVEDPVSWTAEFRVTGSVVNTTY